MLGYMSGAPILPFAGYGHENYISDFKHFRRPTYHLKVGKPFRLDMGDKRVKGEMRQEMADEIMYQLAALLPPEQRGAYANMAQATEEHLEFLEPGRSNLRFVERPEARSGRVVRLRLVGVSR